MRKEIEYCLLASLVMLSAVSCQIENPLSEGISFVADVSTQTKGNQKQCYDSADKIGVIALNASDATAAPYMDNYQLSTTDGVNWTYSPERLWPDFDLDFFAMYPYMTSTEGANGLSLTDYHPFTMSYHAPADITKHPDLMTASTSVDYTPLKRGTVKLNMRHRLSGINFVLAANVSSRLILTSIVIKGVYLDASIYAEGVDFGSSTAGLVTLSYPANEAKQEFFNNQDSNPEGTNVIPGAYSFMLPPQDLSQAASPSVDIFYRIDVGGEDFSFNFPLTGIWKEGKTYNYKLSYDGRNFAATLTDFESASWK